MLRQIPLKLLYTDQGEEVARRISDEFYIHGLKENKDYSATRLVLFEESDGRLEKTLVEASDGVLLVVANESKFAFVSGVYGGAHAIASFVDANRDKLEGAEKK